MVMYFEIKYKSGEVEIVKTGKELVSAVIFDDVTEFKIIKDGELVKSFVLDVDES